MENKDDDLPPPPPHQSNVSEGVLFRVSSSSSDVSHNDNEEMEPEEKDNKAATDENVVDEPETTRQRHRSGVVFNVPLSTETMTRRRPDKSQDPQKHMIISVKRPVYTQAQFDKVITPTPKHSKTPGERVQEIRAKCQCSHKCARKAVSKVFPFVRILKGYSRADFFSDLVAGLTVGIMHIPQGN